MMKKRKITKSEFDIAMNIYGLANFEEFESAPKYSIGKCTFIHSSEANHIIANGKKDISSEICLAMEKCGEHFPGGENFWYDEIRTIPGFFTLATILNSGEYNQEKVEKLTTATYQRIIELYSKENVTLPDSSRNLQSKKAEKLYKLLNLYKECVNPFAKPITIKNLSNFELRMNKNSCSYANENASAFFQTDERGWIYKTISPIYRNREGYYLTICYYFQNGIGVSIQDEVLHLKYSTSPNSDTAPITDIRLSLTTGDAWQTHFEGKAKPVNDYQIDLLIFSLKKVIKYLKHNFLKNIII